MTVSPIAAIWKGYKFVKANCEVKIGIWEAEIPLRSEHLRKDILLSFI